MCTDQKTTHLTRWCQNLCYFLSYENRPLFATSGLMSSLCCIYLGLLAKWTSLKDVKSNSRCLLMFLTAISARCIFVQMGFPFFLRVPILLLSLVFLAPRSWDVQKSLFRLNVFFIKQRFFKQTPPTKYEEIPVVRRNCLPDKRSKS